MIKYQHAYNSSGQLVQIDDIEKQNGNQKEKYHCISCNNELIPRLGNIRQPHFKHKEIVSCSRETYLHILGKNTFYNEFKSCLENNIPFNIELNQKKICKNHQAKLNVVCNLGEELVKFNLLDHFNNIVKEKREGSFIPDVMLISKNGKDKLFIEIAVTHLSSVHKLSSSYRIIEVSIQDENDLEVIKTHLLSEREKKVKFNNFKTPENKNNHCENNCQLHFDFFIVYSDGRSVLHRKTLDNIYHYLEKQKNRISFYKISNDTFNGGTLRFINNMNYANKFKNLVAKAYQENVKVRNCFLCRYHGDNNSWAMSKKDDLGSPIYCKFLKIECNSNQAVNCEYYKPDIKYVNKLLEL